MKAAPPNSAVKSMTAAQVWLVYGLGVGLGALALTPPIFALGTYAVQAAWLPQLAGFAQGVYLRRIALVLACLGLPLLRRRLPKPPWHALGLWPPARILPPLALGWLGACASVLLLGAILMGSGLLVPRPLGSVAWAPLVARASRLGLGVAFVEEALFRGALLGTLVSSQGPVWAGVTSSVVFAAVHFIAAPWRGGIAVLGLVGTLMCMAATLALATLRRQDLGLAIGLHGGWVAGICIVAGGARVTPGHEIWVSDDLRQGLAPMALMIVSWGLVARLLPTARKEAS